MTFDRRWLAFFVLALGTLMIVLDTTIVNVALPSIQQSLSFNSDSLAWVINAYLLSFGGFLLLGGRLGDLFGQRRLFLLGIALFSLASLLCGLASSQFVLIAGRAIQGLAGAVVSAVGLSLMLNLFSSSADRTKAMGFYGFIAAAGGSVGVLLGGLLTSALDWHFIFFVNLPIGLLVFVLAWKLLPHSRQEKALVHLDVAGAVLVTASLVLLVFGIVNANAAGWLSIATIGCFVVSGILLAIFVRVESRVSSPLVPFRLFASRSLVVANVVGALWSAAMFALFFISALYLQLVLGYSPLKVGLAFLPANVIMAVFSLGVSAKLVMQFGTRLPLAVGLVLEGLGLLLLSQAPVNGLFWVHILLPTLLLGLGAGMALNPVLLIALNDVSPHESGLASGIVNTSFMMGAAIGLAILASLAQAVSSNLLSTGVALPVALTEGYHAAFLVGSLFAFAAAGIAAIFLRTGKPVVA